MKGNLIIKHYFYFFKGSMEVLISKYQELSMFKVKYLSLLLNLVNLTEIINVLI